MYVCVVVVVMFCVTNSGLNALRDQKQHDVKNDVVNVIMIITIIQNILTFLVQTIQLPEDKKY